MSMSLDINGASDAVSVNSHLQQEPQPAINIDVAIFRIRYGEWWAARTQQEALAAAAEWYGIPSAELVDELDPPYRLSFGEMMTTLIESEQGPVPFWFELNRRFQENQQFPQPFALYKS